MAKRVAIVGSRKYPDLGRVARYVGTLPAGAVVVSGGADGVDRAAAAAASARGLATVVYQADWDKHGRSAGYLRNQTIVGDCDELVAFWDGRSRGTLHSINLAVKAGKPVYVFPDYLCPACGADVWDNVPNEPTDECGAEFRCRCGRDLYYCCWPPHEVGITVVGRG